MSSMKSAKNWLGPEPGLCRLNLAEVSGAKPRFVTVRTYLVVNCFKAICRKICRNTLGTLYLHVITPSLDENMVFVAMTC
jgi:hypothetical protein